MSLPALQRRSRARWAISLAGAGMAGATNLPVDEAMIVRAVSSSCRLAWVISRPRHFQCSAWLALKR
jgi:hypothetical protein